MRHILTTLALLLGAANAQAGEPARLWGGEQVRLTLGENGGILEASCARGEIAGPLRFDDQGGFSGQGMFEAGPPGPQRADAPAGVPARFSAKVSGETMTLTVQAGGHAETYVLTRGVRSKVIRCL